MPRGVPAAGFRKTAAALARMSEGHAPRIHIHAAAPIPVIKNEPEVIESYDAIAERLSQRFDILGILTDAAIEGEARSLIVSGPAGLGKSFTVEQKLEVLDEEQFTITKGHIKATGLYRLLYKHRNAGDVIVFDDSDSIFYDDVCLNLLKAVCDTTETRHVSYRVESNMVDEDTADLIPRSFVFEGTIIFITNLDFDAMIEKGHRLAPHLQALVSRSHYIDLQMKNKRDYIVRIKMVVAEGMLRKMGLTEEQEADTVRFIEDNMDKMRELSLRMAIKVGMLRKQGGRWENLARVTCCKVA